MKYTKENIKEILEKQGKRFVSSKEGSSREKTKQFFLYFDGHETDNLTPKSYDIIELELMPSGVLHAKIIYWEIEESKKEGSVGLGDDTTYTHQDDYFIPIENIIEIKLEDVTFGYHEKGIPNE